MILFFLIIIADKFLLSFTIFYILHNRFNQILKKHIFLFLNNNQNFYFFYLTIKNNSFF